MIHQLITKADFPEFVPLSVNIADELVNPYIRDAYEFDVRPLLSATEWLLVQVQPLEPAGALLWSPLRAYWVCQAARALLRWHGTHITPNGVENFADIGQLPVSGARRAELIATVDARAASYLGRLHAALLAYRGPTGTCRRRNTHSARRSGPQTHAL